MTDGYMEALSGAVKQGVKMHAFRSGGGLRVVRLTRGERKDVGYGEHPNIEDALSHAAEDLASPGGPRAYGDVYGKLKPHYLTGSAAPSSELDRWILQGNTVDVRMTDDGQIEVVLKGYGRQELSEDVRKRACGGETVRWSARGRQFESAPSDLPRGGCTTSCLERPAGSKASDDWMYHITKTGLGKDLGQAIAAALEAAEVEVSRE